MSVMFLTVKPFSTKTRKLKSVIGGAVGLTLGAAIIYVIFVAEGMEKPSFVPGVLHNTAELAAFLAGIAIILGCAGWFGWKVILRFREHPGRCIGVAIVWIGIHYSYVHSDLTKEKFGLPWPGGWPSFFSRPKLLGLLNGRRERKALIRNAIVHISLPLLSRPEKSPSDIGRRTWIEM